MDDNVIFIQNFKKEREERKLELAQVYQNNKDLDERIGRIVSAIQRINSLMKELREVSCANNPTPKE